MGNRANYVVIEKGRAHAYCDQWGALGCTLIVAEGARACRDYARTCESVNELMDWSFAEAGFLLDYDEKIAIVFGSPNVDMDAELEPANAKRLRKDLAAFAKGPAAFFRYSAKSWKGWTLAWDERGTDAFAEHLRRREITSIKTQAPSAPKRTKRGPIVKIPRY